MKSIQARFLAAALAVMIGSVMAKSQPAADAPPPPPMHEHEMGFGGHMMGFFADYLNLSDAQQTQMKSIMEKEHPAIKPLMQQMHATRQQLHQYEEGAYDEAKVRALAGQQAQTMVELTVAQTRIHNEMFQVLTTDQQSKMKEFEARREARMQKHMQGHRNGDAPPAPPEQ
jgi:Spy/CpxP family protein refolding chaperone